MAAFTKFRPFVEYLAEEAFDLLTDQLRVALTNTDPTQDSGLLSTITADQIDYTNITENRNVTRTSSGQSSGVYSLVLQDLVLNATGAVPTFRYAVLYDDTPTSPADPLIGYWDYGAGGVTLADGDDFTLDFGASALTITAVDGTNFTLFDQFVEDLAHKQHNFGSDGLRIALTNVAPNAATNFELIDITEINYANLSSRDVSYTGGQTSGTYKLTATDLVLTASGSVDTFRYAVLYNTVSDRLIGYYDRGSAVTLSNGETFTIDFDGTNGVFTLA